MTTRVSIAVLAAGLLAAGAVSAQTYVADLSGLSEVPPNASPALGSIQAELTGTTLVVTGSFSDLLGAYTASHIHRAPVGTNGPVVVGLAPQLAGSFAGSYPAATNTFNLTAAQVADLQAGLHYVNVHSQAFPGGEIRGQLRLHEETVDARETPAAFALHANTPNPFNPTTTLAFSLLETGPARLSVHDLLGREVAVLADGLLERGEHRLGFDAAGLPSGIYIYTLQAGGQQESRRMLLVR